MRLKRIKWRDSHIYITQEPRDFDFDVAIIESVGFVISENAKEIVLAGDIINDEDVRRVIVIPKENIVK